MDDDVLRRGRATNHIVYGEAQALLAGNSLLTLAYEICLDAATKGRVPFDVTVKALADISHAVGVMGVMGGQSLDVSWAGRRLDLEQIETVCHHKTGTLIATSVRCGAMVGGGTPQQIQALSRYGTAIGLAFQVADDILNVVGDAKTLGKSTGTDDAMGKSTFPALLGLDGATKKAESLLEQALDALSDFGDEALPLREIARYIVHRDH
jgi:geranylgeranyl diphosphate synthase type II